MNFAIGDAPAWRLDNPQAIAALVAGRHHDPFSVLGPHPASAGVVLRVLRPEAETAEAIDPDTGKTLGMLLRRHSRGFFEGLISKQKSVPRYRLRFTRADDSWEEEDAYRFPSAFGDLDLHLLGEGRHRRLYEKLGAHPMTWDGVSGTRFAVWAPNASRVSVVGAFNGWDGRRHQMRLHPAVGVWEIFVPDVGSGEFYKYEIIGAHGEMLPAKADPVGFRSEVPPATASVVHGLPRYDWGDEGWMETRSSINDRAAPISIYEVHLGSWRRREDGGYLTYDELADQLIPYVKDLGFTHIECMPVSEHPFSGSWGYQPIGLYAPTSRFGTPEDFARFVDRCHGEGVGVIIDWVPAHFPSDAHGLARFDGTALYEHADPRLGFHRDWNTLIYNFGRREVANFLAANALFWLDQYHIDALRVDAVASMLYLDYSREPGEWIPNANGGNENLEAIAFLRDTNITLFGDYPGATSIAEESTAFPGVSRPVYAGGLGFGFKWNMGWMHDTLEYIGQDPIHRRYHHDRMTFGLLYAFTENFILPLSHDEVVHGKGSLIARMPGDRWQKFANLRAYFTFMWTHPGKKLLFMGGEFAQEREWNHDWGLDWHHLDDPMHSGVRDLIRDLNTVYRGERALHELDCESGGFEWIDASNPELSTFIYLRKGSGEARPAVVVCNFTPVVREDFRIGLPRGGRWREILNSDDGKYGGSGVTNGTVDAIEEPWHGRPASATLRLPPLGALILTCET
ncbi:1,4-alpha-glucan branching protein GlgB [Phyllobacterium salinisoli]|uniref:1,4-alpha-glucan branching enzyme GlgB n=1 Tax=Phyllobacterium salinisoli TaxID=1899321 RepID=A0A368K7G1_9HYPH|nr:1,4-alpha-glucan branching protein GlgB [Phyllobacterium salinisoli]RCS25328.1 1,4-alpha-glucan branching protein GlgB [Phyllobacterium salinisoli]